MIDLKGFTTDLEERDGILFAKKESLVSYPEVGNDLCFQIEEDSFWFRHRNNCILESVKKYAPGSIFFDIGGGNGFVAKGLEKEGMQTVLIEPGIKGCLNAKKRKLENIVCSTLENASFIKNSIPAAGLFDVVEHIEDDEAFLQSIQSYLAPGGKVFITVPAYKFLWSNEDDDAGHFRRYSVAEMNRKLEKAGFEIVYSTYIFSILPLPVFLFRSLPSRLGLHKNSQELSKHQNEHKEKKGLLSNLLDKIWNFERNRIKAGKRIGIGGSCLVVAQKIKN